MQQIGKDDIIGKLHVKIPDRWTCMEQKKKARLVGEGVGHTQYELKVQKKGLVDNPLPLMPTISR